MMKVLIFKTDLTTYTDIHFVQTIFDNHTSILDWSVDLEDIDNVLRIETVDSLVEEDIIRLLSSHKIECEDLPN